jgi:glycosyltransferase involved in cell wall biosynthesis
LDAKLVIIGEGPERAPIEKIAEQLGIRDRVLLTGAMAEPERLLKRFDVFALTSDTEQMPNSVLEAMAAGLPVVSTDVGDVKEMLAPENSDFVYAAADEPRFVDGLRRLLTDRALRCQIGQSNALKVSSTYALESMVSRYDALYRGPSHLALARERTI